MTRWPSLYAEIAVDLLGVAKAMADGSYWKEDFDVEYPRPPGDTSVGD